SMFNPDLKPQKSKNFEIGIKGNLLFLDEEIFKSVYFDVTFFNSKIEDEIVPFEVFGDVFYRNAAKTNRSGLEVGLNAELYKGLRLKSSYTLSDFTYDAYEARTIHNDSTVTVASFSDNHVPSVPEHNFSLAVLYENRLNESLTGFLKLNYNNVSGLYTDDGNTEKSEGYAVMNSTLGFDWIISRFQVIFSCGMNNMFNKTYVAFVNINSAQKEYYEVGEPRNFFTGFNISYTF
ncbi:MAG: TonB-dependent receptor, partial [Bacteroidetes bacterium]